MAIFPRHLAPAGAPISAGDLLRWGRATASSRSGTEALQQALREHFGEHSYFLASTGRAGLTLLLRAMRQLAPSHRDEVLIPAYTCYSLPASATRAGLKVRLVDVDPGTLDFDRAALAEADFSRVLAVVATNLYGLPSALPALVEVTRREGVFLIDDAAQSMGASIDGRPSGLSGDAGLFSFDKGKGVSAIDGGAVVTASAPLAVALGREMAALPPPSVATRSMNAVKVLAYFAMLRPTAYGTAIRLPGLGLGQTRFAPDFPLSGPDPHLSALAAVMLPHLREFTAARVANAAALRSGLADVGDVTTIAPLPGAVPSYLRFPILLPTRGVRDAVLEALTRCGIGATGSYPACLADVPEMRGILANSDADFHGARRVAACIATLPTHPFVTLTDTRSAVARIDHGVRIACAA